MTTILIEKILIVDDEPDVLETLEELPSMCELHLASSFDEAKKLMISGDLDMVILLKAYFSS